VTSFGCDEFGAAGATSSFTAPAVIKCLSAGGRCIGKTVTDELSLGCGAQVSSPRVSPWCQPWCQRIRNTCYEHVVTCCSVVRMPGSPETTYATRFATLLVRRMWWAGRRRAAPWQWRRASWTSLWVPTSSAMCVCLRRAAVSSLFARRSTRYANCNCPGHPG
jgi:hypothetical protein